MKWSHFLLLFQAMVTLTIGMIFMAQVISLDLQKVAEYKIEVMSENPENVITQEYIDLKSRYASAAYVLLFVSICELIIILNIIMK